MKIGKTIFYVTQQNDPDPYLTVVVYVFARF